MTVPVVKNMSASVRKWLLNYAKANHRNASLFARCSCSSANSGVVRKQQSRVEKIDHDIVQPPWHSLGIANSGSKSI